MSGGGNVSREQCVQNCGSVWGVSGTNTPVYRSCVQGCQSLHPQSMLMPRPPFSKAELESIHTMHADVYHRDDHYGRSFSDEPSKRVFYGGNQQKSCNGSCPY